MGVPSFYKWLVGKYPNIVVPAKEDDEAGAGTSWPPSPGDEQAQAGRPAQWRLPQPVPRHERHHPPLLPPGGQGKYDFLPSPSPPYWLGCFGRWRADGGGYLGVR